MGQPLSPAEWNALLETTCGVEIESLLTPFYTRPPELGPALPALRELMRETLTGLGELGRTVTVVSVGTVEQGWEQLHSALPPALVEELEDGLRHGLREHLRSDLWAELKLLSIEDGVLAPAAARRWDAIELALWLTFQDGPWDHFEACLPHPLWSGVRTRVRQSFHAALCHRITYLVTRSASFPEFVSLPLRTLPVGARVIPLLRCFREGNYPVGRLERGTFLVLVA
ncbi:MAG TPA: hypothetical protein VK689_21605 [Armatimonadota bacterium]|nr:hypothetical protein [Armatimonadota bacterium]